MKIRHIGIVVDDIEKAIEFYSELFQPCGLHHGSEEWNTNKLQIAKLHVEYSLDIELIQGKWWDHICIEVDKAELKNILEHSELLTLKMKDDHNVYFVTGYGNKIFELYYRKGE